MYLKNISIDINKNVTNKMKVSNQKNIILSQIKFSVIFPPVFMLVNKNRGPLHESYAIQFLSLSFCICTDKFTL